MIKLGRQVRGSGKLADYDGWYPLMNGDVTSGYLSVRYYRRLGVMRNADGAVDQENFRLLPARGSGNVETGRIWQTNLLCETLGEARACFAESYLLAQEYDRQFSQLSGTVERSLQEIQARYPGDMIVRPAEIPRSKGWQAAGRPWCENVVVAVAGEFSAANEIIGIHSPSECRVRGKDKRGHNLHIRYIFALARRDAIPEVERLGLLVKPLYGSMTSALKERAAAMFSIMTNEPRFRITL